jgi:hypothetical protein
MQRRRFVGTLGGALLLGLAPTWMRVGRLGATSHDLVFADGFEPRLLDPTRMPYLGAFRLPAEGFGEVPGSSFGDVTNPVIGIGSAPDRLYAVGSDLGETMEVRTLCEVGIPPLVGGDELAALNVAPYRQPFANLLDDVPVDAGAWPEGRVITGLHRDPVSGRVAVNVTAYYDTNLPPNADTTLVLPRGDALADGFGKRGYFRMTGGARSSGWISPIPADLQGPDALDGTHLFGNSDGYGINGRASIGPSAFVYRADTITGELPPLDGAALDAIAVIDYPYDTPLTPIEDYESPGQLWTALSKACYGFIVPGTQTYLVIGSSGGHASGVSYGVPTYGGHNGFYPNSETDVGNHYWAFHVGDMIAVRRGEALPHEVRPYAHGDLLLRFQGPREYGAFHRANGAAFDPSTGRLYIALTFADASRGEALPLIVAYQVAAAGG